MTIVTMTMAFDARCGDVLSIDADMKLTVAEPVSEGVCQASRDLQCGELVAFDPATGKME